MIKVGQILTTHGHKGEVKVLADIQKIIAESVELWYPEMNS
jgi:ribosomal 30S subunit maturation factor RimM